MQIILFLNVRDTKYFTPLIIPLFFPFLIACLLACLLTNFFLILCALCHSVGVADGQDEDSGACKHIAMNKKSFQRIFNSISSKHSGTLAAAANKVFKYKF